MEIATVPYHIIENLSSDNHIRHGAGNEVCCFAAIEDNTIAGLAMTIEMPGDKTILLRHLKIITPYLRKGIGSRMLSEIICYPDFKDYKMYAYFSSGKCNVGVADSFFSHHGYKKELQSFEYRIQLDIWRKLISAKALGKSRSITHTKSYNQLSSDEKSQAEKIHKHSGGDNDLSVYAVKDGKIIGWSIAGIYNQCDLYLYSSYVYPQYRNNKEGFALWKALFNEDRLRRISHIRNIVFCVNPANNKVNRLLCLFIEKGTPIQQYENYTVDLK